MALFDVDPHLWTYGKRSWEVLYNSMLAALQTFLGSKGGHASLGAGISTVENEVIDARDGGSSLLAKNQAQDSRMDVSLNPDGTPKVPITVAGEKFKDSGHTPTYISASSFKVAGDLASVYSKNRKLLIQLTGGTVVSTIASSSYSSPDTAIVLKESNIDSTISAISYSIIDAESAPDIPEINELFNLIFTLADYTANATSIALGFIKGWFDSFVVANEQGADEANSTGAVHDSTNKLYKGADPGTGLNSDKDYTAESNYLQQEWTNANQSTSQATVATGTTVTISSGVWPINCSKARVSFDSGSTWFNIDTRDSDTQLTLSTVATNGTYDFIIRMSQFDSGSVQLNLTGGVGYGSDVTSGESITTNATVSSGPIGKAIDDDTGTSIDFGTTDTYPRHYKVQFSLAKTITKLVINVNGSEGRAKVVSFNLKGSNDDSSWSSAIYSTTGKNFTLTNGSSDTFTFTNTTSYLYYRIEWTASSHGSSLPTTYEIEMMEDGEGVPVSERISVCDIEASKTDTTPWSDINFASVAETLDSQVAYYWLSFDSVSSFGDGTEIKIFNTTGAVWRKIARNNSGTWEYNNDATNTAVETWVASAVNDMLHAVSQAVSSQTSNRMTGTNLAAITDTQWEETGGWSTSTNSIIRGLTLYSDNSSQNPSVSQYRINYDSERGAMDLRSKSYDPGFVPVSAYLWAKVQHSDSDGPGNFYVSRNGGTDWLAATLSQEGPTIAGDIRVMVVSDGSIDLSLESSGQDLRCRYVTVQGKDQSILSWGIRGKEL